MVQISSKRAIVIEHGPTSVATGSMNMQLVMEGLLINAYIVLVDMLCKEGVVFRSLEHNC